MKQDSSTLLLALRQAVPQQPPIIHLSDTGQADQTLQDSIMPSWDLMQVTAIQLEITMYFLVIKVADLILQVHQILL